MIAEFDWVLKEQPGVLLKAWVVGGTTALPGQNHLAKEAQQLYIPPGGQESSSMLEPTATWSHLEIGIDVDGLKGVDLPRAVPGWQCRSVPGSSRVTSAEGFAMLSLPLLCIDRWQSFLLKLSNTLGNWTPRVSSTTDSLTMEMLHRRAMSSLQSYCFWHHGRGDLRSST